MKASAERIDPKHLSLLWAGVDRAEEIARVHAMLFDQPWSAESLRSLLDHPATTSFVAAHGKPRDVVGFVVAQIAADEAEILSVGVAPGWQRNGIGRMLVEGLMRAVQRAEVLRVHLEVAEDNQAACELYARLGFASTGRRKGYYVRANGPAADAVTMSRTL
jgi:[ribosomal protein S18]-alanine N-acetyltransferase